MKDWKSLILRSKKRCTSIENPSNVKVLSYFFSYDTNQDELVETLFLIKKRKWSQVKNIVDHIHNARSITNRKACTSTDIGCHLSMNLNHNTWSKYTSPSGVSTAKNTTNLLLYLDCQAWDHSLFLCNRIWTKIHEQNGIEQVIYVFLDLVTSTKSWHASQTSSLFSKIVSIF
jgi:hypothetical protein